MSATSHELALRHLLAMSADIHTAALMDPAGMVLAAAPAPIGERARELIEALGAEAGSLATPDAAVELDATCEDGSVFVVRDRGRVMLSVTGPSVLPGLIFHDMHAVLNDLERASARAGAGRAASVGG